MVHVRGHCGILLMMALLAGPAYGTDHDIRQAGRRVQAEGLTDTLEEVRKAIAQDAEDTNRRIDKLQGDLNNARRGNPKLNNQRTQLLEKLIQEERDNLPRRIDDRIARAPGSVGDFLSRARRVGTTGLLAVVSFYTADAIGGLETIANPNTKFGMMYRQALRGNCAWLQPRANSQEWFRQLELELLERHVKNAGAITEEFVRRIRQACRAKPR